MRKNCVIFNNENTFIKWMVFYIFHWCFLLCCLNIQFEGIHFIVFIIMIMYITQLNFCGHNTSLQWRHKGRDGVSTHQPHNCLLNRLFMRRSKKTSKLRSTGLCEGNSPVTGEFPAQRASNSKKISFWWRHHGGASFHITVSVLQDHNPLC